ncbi:MAG: hypothetical protein ABSA75_01270 [Candidatus Bathyarchaeia archaeon]|jgi:hypothetical protein
MVRNLDLEYTTSIKTKRDNFETPLLDAREKLIMPLLVRIISSTEKVKGFA